MIYEFICDETGETLDKEFPMADVPGEFEEDGKVFRRNWASTGDIHIPAHMKALSHSRMNFNKRPSGQKRLF